jgi:hypothetical protein
MTEELSARISCGYRLWRKGRVDPPKGRTHSGLPAWPPATGLPLTGGWLRPPGRSCAWNPIPPSRSGRASFVILGGALWHVGGA